MPQRSDRARIARPRRGRRARWASVASSVVLALLGAPPAASAQSPYRLDVQHLHPSAMPESGIAVEGGRSQPAWVVSAAASFHFGSRLLRATDPRGVEQAVLLDHQAVLEPAFALTLPLGFAFELSWPFVVAAADTESARSLTLPPLRGQGIGDPRIGLSWRLEPIPELTILAGATVTIPTLGAGDAWAELGAEPGASLVGRVGLEGRIAIVVLRGIAGVRGRFEDASVGSAFDLGSELLFGAAAEVRPIPELHVMAELHGSSAFDGFGTRDKTPVELIGAVRVVPLRDLEIVPFGGVGLSEGYGTPAWRVGLTLRFYPHVRDDDGDGVADEQDRCPGEQEDRDGFQDDDGCLDADNDADGVLDADDRCPNVPGLGRFAGCPDPDGDHDGVAEGDRCPDLAEDQDGFEDDDGCPEPDNDGDGIADGEDRCPNDAEDRDGFEDEDGCPEPDNDRDGSPTRPTVARGTPRTSTASRTRTAASTRTTTATACRTPRTDRPIPAGTSACAATSRRRRADATRTIPTDAPTARSAWTSRRAASASHPSSSTPTRTSSSSGASRTCSTSPRCSPRTRGSAG
ncbi:MAG: hypothetical protein M5U28_56480 [Sandaracinaceae bacterium]|nr:hypothetical protein [Sandaracinaceae bacterium]